MQSLKVMYLNNLSCHRHSDPICLDCMVNKLHCVCQVCGADHKTLTFGAPPPVHLARLKMETQLIRRHTKLELERLERMHEESIQRRDLVQQHVDRIERTLEESKQKLHSTTFKAIALGVTFFRLFLVMYGVLDSFYFWSCMACLCGFTRVGLSF